MRFTIILATLAAAVSAAPASSASSLEETAVVLDSQADLCKNQDSYDICRSNCSPLAPAFACQINCLIAFCP
ncbi:hypothetical protein B0T11DRAFT_331319 [Plectosphaerella cucumerina]|uniref:Uncharacterized protein n=1 Tax=Plectosphaerella cucumerina TaxID=40658 RepID=A0A8K0WZV7_9PEZI|nr:hypothetical protein B0T11DRAFT_331319 [Plectosphaerella cucumerina]